MLLTCLSLALLLGLQEPTLVLAGVEGSHPLNASQAAAASARLGAMKSLAFAHSEYARTAMIAEEVTKKAAWDTECASVQDSDCAGEACYYRKDHDAAVEITEAECTAAGTGHTWMAVRSVCIKAGVTQSSDCHDGNNDFHGYQFGGARDLCCYEGEKKCKIGPDGEEYRSGQGCELATICTDAYKDHQDPEYRKHYAVVCTLEGARGIALLGTSQPACGQCMADVSGTSETERLIPEGKDSQSSCESQVPCVGGTDGWRCGSGDSTCCANAGGNETSAIYSLRNDLLTEAGCEERSCGFCAGKPGGDSDPGHCSRHGSCSKAGLISHDATPASCSSTGDVFTPYNWQTLTNYSAEERCQSDGFRWTDGVRSYESGDILQAGYSSLVPSGYNAELANSSDYPWQHGGQHVEPSHLLSPSLCASEDQFLADAAAGKTAAQAYADNKTYYLTEFYRQTLQRAYVASAPSAVLKAKITFNTDYASRLCFIGLVQATNRGAVDFQTTDDSYILIVDPLNLPGGEPSSVTGTGKVTVLGGYSAGGMALATTGQIEIFGLTNHGPITASNAEDVMISDVSNGAGGSITATNVKATLRNVVNSGTISATGSTIALFEVTNTGNVSFTGTATGEGIDLISGEVAVGANSRIDIKLKPCADTGSHKGTISIAEGVTGTLEYTAGCATLTNNAGDGLAVTEVALDAGAAAPKRVQAKVVATETFTAGILPSSSDLLSSAAYVTGKKLGLQGALGIASTDDITVTSFDVAAVARRLAGETGRRLSTVMASVTTNFEVQVSDASAASQVTAKLEAPGTAALIKQETDTAMAQQDWAANGGAAGSAPPTMSTPAVSVVGRVAMPDGVAFSGAMNGLAPPLWGAWNALAAALLVLAMP